MGTRYRSTEKDILDYLSFQGFDQSGTTLHEVELVGIKRPGWLQIFTFTVSTNSDEAQNTWFGVLRDDQRTTSDFFLLQTEPDQRRVVGRLTEGLITRNRIPVSTAITVALIAVGLLLAGLAFMAVSRGDSAAYGSSAWHGSDSNRYRTDQATPADQKSVDSRVQTVFESEGE